ISMGGNSYQLALDPCKARGIAVGLNGICDTSGTGSPGGDDGAPGSAAVQAISLDKSQATGRSHSPLRKNDLPGGDASPSGPRTITNPTDSGFRGVAVTATNSDNLAAVGISASLGGSAGVAVSGVVTVFETHTDAHIGQNAKVNCSTTGDCSTNPGTQNNVR